jgi:hypothetical protein
MLRFYGLATHPFEKYELNKLIYCQYGEYILRTEKNTLFKVTALHTDNPVYQCGVYIDPAVKRSKLSLPPIGKVKWRVLGDEEIIVLAQNIMDTPQEKTGIKRRSK